MPEIIKVDTNDKLRTLLTDVLPYELPLWFSNFTMYKRFSTSTHARAYKAVSGLDFGSKSGSYIPLDYLVSRGGEKSPRVISIMHPAAQLKVCEFYYEYDDLIEYYCTKSKYSLRHPYRKTTKFFGKVQKGSKLADGVESADEERIVSSSYFKYKKYPFLYRFFESYEYHKLEKQFHSMLQVDVSKCFPSVYTHSIGWAIKSKKVAKENASFVKGDFDGEFDKLMQLTNYRETNGIIVGPEVSRIFAEVILQKIDLNLVEKMSKNEYQVSKDYDFRRYVDDYFVFFRSEEVKAAFIKALESSLLEYKMFLNEAKTTIASRPFATDISLAKSALKRTVSECYSSRFMKQDIDSVSILQLKNPSSKANKTIAEIKMALANHKVEYHSISNYLFSAITKRMISYMSKLEGIDVKDFHLNWILVDLDVLFFVHAMDIRIRPTDRLARLINDLVEKTSNWSEIQKEIIHKKIFDHVKQAINIFINHANDMIGLETLNLLIILTMLPSKYQLPEKNLNEYRDLLKNPAETAGFYFYWVTFMLYIHTRPEYQQTRDQLIQEASVYLLNHDDMFTASEYFMFYFDYLACPHIDVTVRKTMMNDVKNITLDNKQKAVSFNVNTHSNILLNKDFIVSWRDPKYLKNSLEKKEYIFSYN